MRTFSLVVTAVSAARVNVEEHDKPVTVPASLVHTLEESAGVGRLITATGVGGTTGVGKSTAQYCLEVWGNEVRKPGTKVAFAKCDSNKESQKWYWNQNEQNKLQVGPDYLCLTQNEATETGKPAVLTIEKCGANPRKSFQEWKWQNGQQSGTRQLKNVAQAQCMGVKFATGAGWGNTMMATSWKCSWKKDKNTDFNLCNTGDKVGCQAAMSSSLLQVVEAASGGVKGLITATGVGGTTGVGVTNAHYCLEVWGNKVEKVGQKVAFAKCNKNKESQMWTYNANGDNKLQIGPKYLCLTQKEATKPGEPKDLTLERCTTTPKKSFQEWKWQNGQQTGTRQIQNTGQKQCIGVKYATGAGWGETMMATSWKCAWKKDKNTDFNLCNTKDKVGCEAAMR